MFAIDFGSGVKMPEQPTCLYVPVPQPAPHPAIARTQLSHCAHQHLFGAAKIYLIKETIARRMLGIFMVLWGRRLWSAIRAVRGACGTITLIKRENRPEESKVVWRHMEAVLVPSTKRNELHDHRARQTSYVRAFGGIGGGQNVPRWFDRLRFTRGGTS
jgi:hypothetical protein